MSSYEQPPGDAGNSPPPQLSQQDARMWATVAHLAGFLMYTAIPFASILGPLVVWMLKRQQSAYVDDQGKEAVNFQISMALYAILLVPTVCIGIGVFLLPALGVVHVILMVIAALKANAGENYRYPLTIRFVK
jgi:uncharacterized Tic20 family protein